MFWNAGWPSGKPMRPPPGAGMAHTGSLAASTSAMATSQAPLASMSGPATKTGLRAVASRCARSRTTSGSAVARPVTRRPIACSAAAASTGTSQSSMGMETKTGPAGGSVATCAARASASGTSSAAGGS